MPLYEYRCKSCGHQFEKIQSFSAPEEKVCPACGGEVERLISAPAVQFKGSGWYVTDYARSGSNAKRADSKNSESGGKDTAGKDSGGKEGGAPTDTSKSSGDTSGSTPAPAPAKKTE